MAGPPRATPAGSSSPNPITPELLLLVESIGRHGSFAKAARELGKVPSAVTYSVRQLEDRLDVLLFDRSGHRAVLTDAGAALLRDGRVVLQSLDDLTRRVRRIATGWELELRIAVSAVLAWDPLYDLIAAFQEVGGATKLRFSHEVLSGTWDALVAGRADLVIGADASAAPPGGYKSRDLGVAQFSFCVAPHHPLATIDRPLTSVDIAAHCAIVVADTARDRPPMTRNLLDLQPAIVLPTMQAKIEAQIRGLGCGYLPRALAWPYLQRGVLVEKATQDGQPVQERLVYAWHAAAPGAALKWWLDKLQSPRLCRSLVAAAAPA